MHDVINQSVTKKYAMYLISENKIIYSLRNYDK